MLPHAAMMVLAVAILQGPDDSLDGTQICQLIQAVHAPLRDVSFVFEGRMQGVPANLSVPRIVAGESRDAPFMSYQGQYIYRSDGAIRYDAIIQENVSDVPLEYRHLAAALGKSLQEVQLTPTGRDEQPRTRTGAAGSLDQPGSPERIFRLWYLLPIEVRVSLGYRFLGWEEVDGHRCAKVEFTQTSPDDPEGERLLGDRYWIDLERGGHPLKVETFDRHGVSSRLAGVRLAQFENPDGGMVWLPVEGYSESFVGTTPYPTKAVAVETYHVVAGTVRVNQSLPDSVFRLDWNGGDRLPRTDALTQAFATFRKPQPRRDPEGVRQALGAKLERVEAKAPCLTAEPPARRARDRDKVLQWSLGAVGVTLLAAAAWAYRRAHAG